LVYGDDMNLLGDNMRGGGHRSEWNSEDGHKQKRLRTTAPHDVFVS
jgi:hypothetical protein